MLKLEQNVWKLIAIMYKLTIITITSNNIDNYNYKYVSGNNWFTLLEIKTQIFASAYILMLLHQ